MLPIDYFVVVSAVSAVWSSSVEHWCHRSLLLLVPLFTVLPCLRRLFP